MYYVRKYFDMSRHISWSWGSLLTCYVTVDRTLVHLTGWCKFMLANSTRMMTVALLPIYQFVIVSERNGILDGIAILRRKFEGSATTGFETKLWRTSASETATKPLVSLSRVFSFILCAQGAVWEGVVMATLRSSAFQRLPGLAVENGRTFRPI